MASHHAQKPIDPDEWEPKHKVFLCHSGAQKGFVEQLDKDLRSVDQNPFFDKDRESLPIGDHFPTFIFKAIEHCDVGVVFLSEEFFMRSHWPMFEVMKMVECGRRVMPIFLGISPGDLSNEDKVENWKLKWDAWRKVNERIDVAKWESTLRFLRGLNGLVYNDAVGEVKFREEIMKEVCKRVPSFHVWDDSHVQGMSRIRKIIKEKLSETSVSKKGVQVVGLYGVGGIGKTTTCKCLFTDLALEFDGRVCCIELGDGTSELERVREVLKRLTSTNNEFLKEKNLDECWIRLKNRLGLKKVVLAIDNVTTSSKICEEARRYLRLEYGKGSIVMVTARALGELENLCIKSDNCLTMPELVKEEARALFLYHAKCEDELEEEVVMRCIRRCYFGKGDGSGLKHYHPLTLKVLGSQLVGRHPTEWKSQLKGKDVFNQRREEKNPVFSILGTSFDALRPEDKMLFMDVALFDEGRSRKNVSNLLEFQLRFEEVHSWFTIFEWLSIVHGINVDEVKERLNELKRRSLLEELGDGTGQIGMHDLWREFAVMNAKHGEEGDSKWVYEDNVEDNEGSAESCMFGGGWENLRRICIWNRDIKSLNFNECSKVIALRLKDVYIENGVLDLSGLKSIKSLEIDCREIRVVKQQVVSGIRQLLILKLSTWLDDGESFDEELEQQFVSGIGQLLNLKILTLHNIDERFVEEISRLSNLQVLHLLSAEKEGGKSSTSLDLQQLKYLQDVRVALPNMVSISGFSSEMKKLRILVLAGCDRLKRCVGVGDLDSLEVLLLNDCWALKELPNLQMLTGLRILDISNCSRLKALPGLGSLVALRMLRANGYAVYRDLKELPCLSNLAQLEILDLSRCCKLKSIPGLGNLDALRELGVHSYCLPVFSGLRNLSKLQKLVIFGWQHHRENFSETLIQTFFGMTPSVSNLAMLESVRTLEICRSDLGLRNVCKLTALKSLQLRECEVMRFPDMGRDMRLESLKLGWCSLISIPDLSKFPSLQYLQIYKCFHLTSLTISEPLSVLSYIELVECKELRTVPNIDLIPRLNYFQFYNCGVQLNEHEVQKLEARGFQDYGNGRFALTL